MTAKQLSRLQNCIIALLTLSAAFLFASLPLFGALSDQSLVDLARERFRREAEAPSAEASRATAFVFPVRIVYTNDFARVGADALTTLSDEFERAGTYLGEAFGSAYGAEPASEATFLAALAGKGLYFDFPAALPSGVLSALLGVSAPEAELSGVRRVLLSSEGGDVALYVQDGDGRSVRFSTAVNGAALSDFLAAHSGDSADFAFLLGEGYERLSPYTLILSEPSPRGALLAANVLSENEETFLRRAEFNAHTANRFTESSGTVLVREASNALYLRPDGTVDYQGGEAAPDSLYFVAASGDAPTLSEAAGTAQTLVAALTQDLLGDAALYLSGASESGDGHFEITFDLMAGGTPLRFSDGSHAAVITVEERSITAFTLKARGYTLSESEPLLLPFALSAAIARVWDGAELLVAYVDTGAEEVLSTWVAE